MVDDLDAALTFYCDVLGFEVLPRPEEFGPGAWLQVGSAQLHIGVVDQMPEKGGGFPRTSRCTYRRRLRRHHRPPSPSAASRS